MMRTAILLCASVFLVFAPPPVSAQDDPTRRPVASGRDLHIACGQTLEDFPDRIYEPVARSIMLVQCHAIVNAVTEMIRNGVYLQDGEPAWTCVNIPERVGSLSEDYVRWIARNPRAGRLPAVLAFVRAVEETYPCADAIQDR